MSAGAMQKRFLTEGTRPAQGEPPSNAIAKHRAMPLPSTVCKALHAAADLNDDTMWELALEGEAQRLSSTWNNLSSKDVTTDSWTRTPASHCPAVMTYVMHITTEMSFRTHNLQVQLLQSSEHNTAEHSMKTRKAGKHLCEQWLITAIDLLLTCTNIRSLRT